MDSASASGWEMAAAARAVLDLAAATAATGWEMAATAAAATKGAGS